MAETEGTMDECPICMNKLEEADVLYPTLCPTDCGYNFCCSCVTHLLDSSRDDYEMASDGNRHVKVRLQCPQCRGDLSATIEDTLLLRKAKAAERVRGIPDSELNATELRMKHEFVELYANDVAHAEARVRKYMRDRAVSTGRQSRSKGETVEVSNGTEIGPKAIDFGPPNGGHSKATATVFIDTTLFQGMDFAMSRPEQEYVQELLTSGNVERVAQAAQILHGVFDLTLNGLKPPQSTVTRSRNEERKLIEMSEAFRKRYPIPSRMPKFVVLDAFPLKDRTMMFSDDEWNGSIADAFSRVHRQRSQTPASVDAILGLASPEDLHHEPKPRVKIASIRGQAGRVGLQKGDVITHVNGEEFRGTAADLKGLIASFHADRSDRTFQLVVNADESTACVLKLRSIACQTAMTTMASVEI